MDSIFAKLAKNRRKLQPIGEFHCDFATLPSGCQLLSFFATPSKVFVYGDSFVKHNITCFIDKNAYLATFMTSSQIIICRFVDDDLVAATYEVRVSNDGHYANTSSLKLETTAVPYIAEVDPPIGLSGGDTKLHGKGFHNQMMCHARDSGVLVSQFINSSAVRYFLPQLQCLFRFYLHLPIG
eukprot:scaffold18187_cov35-Cyclotella_meneghiniana.AAC.4